MADKGTNSGNAPVECKLHDIRLDRLEHRTDTIDKRTEALEDGQLMMAREVSEVRATIGHAPNLATGTAGDGMAQVVYRMASAMTQRGMLPSSVDEGEGEITKVQSRDELLARAKAAEATVRVHEEARRQSRSERRERMAFWLKLAAAVGGGAGITELLRQLVGG